VTEEVVGVFVRFSLRRFRINCRIGLYEGLNGSVLPGMFIFLALALTIPAVTVDARLNGFQLQLPILNFNGITVAK
jgi:hypothetical protein